MLLPKLTNSRGKASLRVGDSALLPVPLREGGVLVLNDQVSTAGSSPDPPTTSSRQQLTAAAAAQTCSNCKGRTFTMDV